LGVERDQSTISRWISKFPAELGSCVLDPANGLDEDTRRTVHQLLTATDSRRAKTVKNRSLEGDHHD
jgi:hypothetical protein